MRRMTFVFAGLAVAAVLVFAQMTFAADMLSGTWKLNLAKSKYSPANLAPKSGTTKFEATQDGVKTVTDGVDSQGRKTHTEYTAKFDGKDSPWKGTIDGRPNPDQDAVAWKKIDDYTYDLTNKLKGQVLTSQRTVISRDGKSRTNTLTGKNAQGQPVSNTVVYEKQ
jgi:histidinol dehydrogenase